eukprot:SAG11_NODE_31378_length_292_cov_0.808290_1_plen_61_part_10
MGQTRGRAGTIRRGARGACASTGGAPLAVLARRLACDGPVLLAGERVAAGAGDRDSLQFRV